MPRFPDVISPYRGDEISVPYHPEQFDALAAYVDALPYVDAERNADGIHLNLAWSFAPGRHTIRYAYHLDGVTTTQFTVPPRNEWEGKDKHALMVTIGNGTDPAPERVTVAELRERLREYHPLRPQGTAEELDRTCDVVADWLSYAIYHEFGIAGTRTTGWICTPDRGRLEKHMFNVVPSQFITGVENPVVIDGTARQYADEGEVTVPVFGPQNTIPLMQVVQPSDDRYEYYDWEQHG